MKEEILKILTEIRPEFDFSKSEDFIREGLLDSFDVIALVSALDNHFSVSIDGLDIVPDNFSNIQKIHNLLLKSGVKHEL